MEYVLHETSHTIKRLAYTMKMHKKYIILKKVKENEIINKNVETTLTAYFKLNQIDSEACNYLYSEIPIHDTFDERLKTWNRRKKTKKPILSRMYLVNPKDRQRYFIRLLLLHVKGAISFKIYVPLIV